MKKCADDTIRWDLKAQNVVARISPVPLFNENVLEVAGTRPKRLKLLAIISCCFIFPVSATAQGSESFELTDDRLVAPLEVFQECSVCPEMIVMPSGSFMMGAIRGESRNPFDFYGPDATGSVRGPNEINIIPHEHPRHPVEMDIPFAIGRNEVTHAEWTACVTDGGCSHVPDHTVLTSRNGNVPLGANHPVMNVSYLDALEYVAWLNAQAGVAAYRLPTEAEWEYAARAGTQTRFAQGDDLNAQQANFSRDATEHVRGRNASFPALANRQMPVPVNALNAANAWGLRHMAGNVGELTMSCATESHLGLTTDHAYLAHAQTQGPCRRISKGGAYNTAMDGLRPAARKQPSEDRRRPFYGFRIIRELSLVGAT